MNAYFENFNDEINQIISRSKKDKNTTIFRIQKSKAPYIYHKNNEIKENRVESLFGVNLHLISKDGYIIYGASNRVHIPDVLSRLYQNLENLIKGNKGHKVNKTVTISNLPKNQVSTINYSDIAELNFDYLNDFLQKIYSELSDEIKELVDIELMLTGSYSLWYIGNSLGGSIEHDDFNLDLVCNLCLKSNQEKKISLSHKLPVEEIRKNEINSDGILRAIKFYSKLITVKTSTKKKEELKPDIIILDKTLTSILFTNLIYSKPDSEAIKNLVFEDRIDIDNNVPSYDNFGFDLGTKRALKIYITHHKVQTLVIRKITTK